MTHNDRRFGGQIERLRAPDRLARLEVPRVVALALADCSPASMLDVGTGSGIFAEAFAAAGLTVSGVDIRPDMLEAAQAFVPEGEFREGRMETLPYPDAAADLVFLGLVLHEADDVTVALREAWRVARQRVCVLEWIYRVEDYGPPLAHRLPVAVVQGSAKDIGFRTIAHTDLTQLTLYIMDK